MWTWQSLDGAVVGGPLCAKCTGERLAAELNGIVDDLEHATDDVEDAADWDSSEGRDEFLQDRVDDFREMVGWWREDRAPFLANPSPYEALAHAEQRAKEVEARAKEKLRVLRRVRAKPQN